MRGEGEGDGEGRGRGEEGTIESEILQQGGTLITFFSSSCCFVKFINFFSTLDNKIIQPRIKFYVHIRMHLDINNTLFI